MLYKKVCGSGSAWVGEGCCDCGRGWFILLYNGWLRDFCSCVLAVDGNRGELWSSRNDAPVEQFSELSVSYHDPPDTGDNMDGRSGFCPPLLGLGAHCSVGRISVSTWPVAAPPPLAPLTSGGNLDPWFSALLSSVKAVWVWMSKLVFGLPLGALFFKVFPFEFIKAACEHMPHCSIVLSAKNFSQIFFGNAWQFARIYGVKFDFDLITVMLHELHTFGE